MPINNQNVLEILKMSFDLFANRGVFAFWVGDKRFKRNHDNYRSSKLTPGEETQVRKYLAKNQVEDRVVIYTTSSHKYGNSVNLLRECLLKRDNGNSFFAVEEVLDATKYKVGDL